MPKVSRPKSAARRLRLHARAPAGTRVSEGKLQVGGGERPAALVGPLHEQETARAQKIAQAKLVHLERPLQPIEVYMHAGERREPVGFDQCVRRTADEARDAQSSQKAAHAGGLPCPEVAAEVRGGEAVRRTGKSPRERGAEGLRGRAVREDELEIGFRWGEICADWRPSLSSWGAARAPWPL
jgi:hypothetical protein